jgi:hypothetical protein
MTLITNFVKLCASTVSTVYSISKIYELKEKLDEKNIIELNNIIADGCNYTYQTYVKEIKKKRKLKTTESKEALLKTFDYVNFRYNNKLKKDKVFRLIEDRLLLMSSKKIL